jgi:hypothetical protein
LGCSFLERHHIILSIKGTTDLKKTSESFLILQQIRQRAELKKTLKENASSKDAENSSYTALKSRLLKLSYLGRITDQSIPEQKNRELYIDIPEVFSLYKNPESVLIIVDQIASLKNVKQINKIMINHINCIEHDLAAETILAAAVTALYSYKTKTGGKFIIEGILPKDEKMKKLLRSIGVVKETANPKYHLKKEDRLRLFKRHSDILEIPTIFGKDKKTRATEDFIDHLNECVLFISAQLDGEEVGKLDYYVGEVLGNAEEHSGTNIWTIVGYLDATDESNLVSEIAIYCVGKTIFETFEEKRDVSIVFDKMNDYIQLHNSNFTDEQLAMVYALQQNVSSKKDEVIDRGQGTKYLIDLFHHLTDECNRINLKRIGEKKALKPSMLILSGSSMLKFDGKYKPSLNEDDKMIYAFNKENNLGVAPDKKYVPSFEGVCFPGTIIYIRFPLSEETLVSTDETEG